MSGAPIDLGALGPVRLPCQFGAVRPAERVNPFRAAEFPPSVAHLPDDEHDDTLGREIHARLLPETP